MSLPVPGSSGCRAPDTRWAPAAAGSSQDAPGAEQGGRTGWWLPLARAGGHRHLSANRLPEVLWLLPLGHPGGDGMSPCSAMWLSARGSGFKRPQRSTRDPPLRPCAREHAEAAGTGMLQPTGAARVHIVPTKGLRNVPASPRAAHPRRNLRGGCLHPLLFPPPGRSGTHPDGARQPCCPHPSCPPAR